ncbi:uncharacterized protein LOC144382410 isoform X5 [Halichoerus grypus]
MKTQMETLALGSPGCRLTLQILGFACLCNSVSWELCSTPFHFGTQAGKAVTILNIAYHCIELSEMYLERSCCGRCQRGCCLCSPLGF